MENSEQGSVWCAPLMADCWRESALQFIRRTAVQFIRRTAVQFIRRTTGMDIESYSNQAELAIYFVTTFYDSAAHFCQPSYEDILMSEPKSQGKEIDPKIYFQKAYNNFDPKPLVGDLLQSFYIEAFSQSAVEELLTTIEITKQYRKLLVVGHRGCGKSTILNKICQNLKTHTVVAFSATDVVNISEIEAIDILLATYIKILEQTHTIENRVRKPRLIRNMKRKKRN